MVNLVQAVDAIMGSMMNLHTKELVPIVTLNFICTNAGLKNQQEREYTSAFATFSVDLLRKYGEQFLQWANQLEDLTIDAINNYKIGDEK